MTLQFQYPWVLYLLWLVPAAGILWHLAVKQRGNPAEGMVSPAMAARLAPAIQPARRFWQMLFFLAGILLAIIAAARPQWGMREETVYQKGRDLLIALDVSRSMLANDVHPSRLGRAKVDLVDLVKQLRGDRVGLLTFRGRPVLLCPLTTDYGFFTQSLEGAGPHSAPRGETNIGDAIMEALSMFQADSGSHQAIVLVSDGEDLAGRVEAAIEKAKERKVAVFTVGFGSTDGARLPAEGDKRGVMVHQGTEVLSKLNHELLSDIATRTGGAYVPVGMANVKLGNLYRDHLSRISAIEQEESLQRRFIERYQLFLFAACLSFLAAAFLSRGRFATAVVRTKPESAPASPQPRNITPPATGLRKLALACLLTGAWWMTAQAMSQTNLPGNGAPAASMAATDVPPGRRGARVAQSLYLRGRYADSAAAYKAAAQSGANRDTWLFNAGCAYLKAGQNEAAADIFRSVGEEREPQGSAAAYNLGYSLAQPSITGSPAAGTTGATAADQRVRQLKQAATAFQQALKLSPDMEDSRLNLALVAAVAPEAESQALIAGLMARYQQTPADRLAGEMLQSQRQLRQKMPAAFSNSTPALISELESLANLQDENANRLIPLKGKLAQAVSQTPAQAVASNAPSPGQQMAYLDAFVESIRDRMKGTAEELRNLDRASQRSAEESEAGIYHLWKGIAAYPALLQEDLLRQTNSIRMTRAMLDTSSSQVPGSIAEEQQEASGLTSLFLKRFEEQVPPEGLDAPQDPAATNAASTNKAEKLITPENRARIVELARQGSQEQRDALDRIRENPSSSLPPQQEAYRILKEIEKLLPRQQNQQQQEQQEQQPQPGQEQQQEQGSQQEQQAPKEEPKPAEQDKDQMSSEHVQRLLEKARQREKEHEQEIRDREQHIPPSPTERDW